VCKITDQQLSKARVYYIICFCLSNLSPDNGITLPPRAPYSLHLPSILPSVADTYFWLVVVWKLIGLRPFNSLTAIGGHDRQLFLSFFGEEILNKFLSNFSV
jgi:hypothetical protein